MAQIPAGQPVVGGRAVPVGVEPHVDRPGRQDCRRPFDRMDFGDQGRNDEPCRVVDLIIAPQRIVRPQFVAKNIVFARKERVKAAQA